MTSRSPRKGRGKPTATARRTQSLTSFTAPEHDPLSDSRLRPLVERYASLAGVTCDEVGPQLLELRLPEEERGFFGGRERVTVAFTVPALELAPEAEMAVVGSSFVEQLLASIRSRGARIKLGTVPPGPTGTVPAPLGIPVRDGSLGTPKMKLARHPVARLLARVVIRAGAAVEEHLVESSFFDLADGVPLPDAAAAACAANERTMAAPSSRRMPKAQSVAPRAWSDLVEVMVGDLRGKLAPRIDKLRADAERALALELERIDSYFHTILEDAAGRRQGEDEDGLFADAARAIEAEHARRRVEEERRHQVRTVVHPLQLVEMDILVERARWPLTSSSGHRAQLAAMRYLGGGEAPTWRVRCPSCDAEASELIVVADGQLGCAACEDAGTT